MSCILKYLPAVMIPAALLIGVCLFWGYSFKMLARERCCGEMIEFRDLLLNGRRLDEIRNIDRVGFLRGNSCHRMYSRRFFSDRVSYWRNGLQYPAAS